MRVCRRWTEEENAILREVYPTEGYRGFLARAKLPRTEQAVHKQVHKLGVQSLRDGPHNNPWWGKEELEALVRTYPSGGYQAYKKEASKKAFPARSAKSIARKARSLGVRSESYFFSEEEIDLVVDTYPWEGLSKTVDRLREKGYTRSKMSVEKLASRQGLLRGVDPYAYES